MLMGSSSRSPDGERPCFDSPKNLLPVHHLSPSQLMISSQYAELVEKANNMGYGRDFAASMIYSMEESGQPLDFNTLFGKIMRQGETSRKSFEAMMKNTGKPPVQRKPQVDLDSRLGKTQCNTSSFYFEGETAHIWRPWVCSVYGRFNYNCATCSTRKTDAFSYGSMGTSY